MPWKVDVPKSDDVYFERMSKAMFSAGLNWKMVDNKWPNFRKAFDGFSMGKVAKFDENDVRRLMADAGIVRNEKKIRATIFNAQEALRLKKEYGSFERFIKSFHGAHDGAIYEITQRFRHVGPSSSRTFMWMVGTKLTPTAEEKAWIESHNRRGKKKEATKE